MGAVVYAETFGHSSEVWMYRQVRALGVPLVTHEFASRAVFPLDQAHVVPKTRRPLDRLRAGWRWLSSRHGYRLPAATEAAVTKKLRELGATVIHAHYGPAGLRMLPVARALGCRLVVTFHGFDVSKLPQRDASYRRALRGLFDAATVVAVSDAVAQRLRDLGCDAPTVIPLGVPVHAVRAPRANDPARVLTVARLHPVKGVPDLVTAILGAGTPLRLDIVGDGEERADVAARAGSDSRIHIHGAQPPDRVRELLDEADVFVLNSRTPAAGDTEGLPISVLEAMEASLPVVATRHGGIPEVVTHEESGLLVAERDTDALQSALEALAGDRGRRERYGAAGRARVERDYDLDRCVERVRSLYR